MTAHGVLAELDRRGIPYRVVGTDLQVKTGAVPPDLLAAIRQHKAEIIAALGGTSISAVPGVPAVPGPELQRRIEVFRKQRREWHDAGHRGEPFYVLFDSIEFEPDTCVSCGADKGPRPPDYPPAAIHLRCPPCVAAVEIVLDEAKS